MVTVIGDIGIAEVRKSWVILCILCGSYAVAIWLFSADRARLRRFEQQHHDMVWNSPQVQLSIDQLLVWQARYEVGGVDTDKEYVHPSEQNDDEPGPAQDNKMPRPQWMRVAVERAVEIEKAREASHVCILARLAPSWGTLLQDFRDDLSREHLLVAAISPKHASLERGPVVLMRLICFIYADALSFSVFGQSGSTMVLDFSGELERYRREFLRVLLGLLVVSFQAFVIVLLVAPCKAMLGIAVDFFDDRIRL